MRYQIFISGILIMVMGFRADRFMEKAQALGFFTAALVLGGCFVICGLFSLKMPWHGFVAAGMIAFLGAAQGVSNIRHFINFLGGDRSRNLSPLLEMGVMLICLLLVIRVYKFIAAERIRKMLAQDDDKNPPEN